MTALKRVLIMAGGTGGHVFPGLSLAKYFRDQHVEVHWLGTDKGLEFKLVPEAGLPLHIIKITGVRGKGKLALLWAPYKVTLAIFQSLQVIRQVKPDLVIGMGGFVSGPGGIASWLSRLPLVIHEQNAIAGTTNKILSKIARKILTGFPGAFKSSPKVEVVGNPVRVEMEVLAPPSERLQQKHSRPHLLVLGGSLGAKALNDLVPRAMAKLKPDERPEIIHQTGEATFSQVKMDYESMEIEAKLIPFSREMAEMYSWADMVLCRAGALTVSEICAVGLGAVLVPFPYAIDDHQTANASYLVKHQAAICKPQNSLTDDQLADIVRELAADSKKRLAMAEAAYRLRRVNVVEKIYKICQEICH